MYALFALLVVLIDALVVWSVLIAGARADDALGER